MHWPKALILSLGLFGAAALQASPIEDLRPVGEARLKVLFWTIYDSRLFTADGRYEGVEPDMALRIVYRQNIAADRLIDRTRKEWRKLGLYDQQDEQWLSRLDEIWPDVNKGDDIIVRVDSELHSRFFYNGRFIGEIADSRFSRHFLSIWLSEQSSYPDLRDQLVGLES